MKSISQILILCVLIVNCRADASPDGDTELLDLIAVKNRVNYTRIITWQGKAEIEEIVSGYDDESLNLRRKSSVVFLSDQAQSSVRYEWTVDGQSYDGNSAYFEPDYLDKYSIGMRIKDKFYDYHKINEKLRNTLLIRDPKHMEGLKRGRVFDPMWYLGRLDIKMSNHIEYISNRAKRLKSNPWKVVHQANLVLIERDEELGLNRMTFDMYQGGLLVQYLGEGRNTNETCEISWEKHGEVWVPSSYSLRNTNGDKVAQRTVRFTQNILNEPITGEEFTYEKLGVKPGDQVQDQLVGINYFYKYDAAVADKTIETNMRVTEGLSEKMPSPTLIAANVDVSKSLDDNHNGTLSQGIEANSSDSSFSAYWLTALCIALAAAFILFLSKYRSKRQSDHLCNE